MLGKVGLPEMLIIAVIALIIFGPRQIPKLGKSLGQSIREFRGIGKEITRGWEDETDSNSDKDKD